MYLDQQYIVIIYLIVTVALVIPLALQSIHIKLFRSFNFKKFIRVLNRAIILQLILGLILTAISIVFDKTLYTDGKGTAFSDIFIESTYCYIVIGVFCYLPAVGFINIANLLTSKVKKSPQK